ncbi:NAC transcription factor 25-like [Camellia sinensis]|uniref:NAC transcription factor 25-like n=1 Tax=Camellia sinensis TaxID=4442 RepID=UPI0010357A78|nr:NAC transcription factor 25-like [Camellia sinensis]
MAAKITIGYKFIPMDKELVLHYLRAKAKGQPLPVKGLVNKCNLYDDQELSKIFSKMRTKSKLYYYFTELKKKNGKGKRIDRLAGKGTWKGLDRGKPIHDNEGRLTGRKRSFDYINRESSEQSVWDMKEYSLEGVSLEDDQLIKNNFQDMQSVNRTAFPKQTDMTAIQDASRYYYHRPTPWDILYEEDFFHGQNSYHGKTIHEWNIDGYSEYQIFECILKGWWDNVLTFNQQHEILNATKTETNPTSNTVTQREDAVYALVQTILYHFIGSTTVNDDRSRELLQNLRYPSLTHFHCIDYMKEQFLQTISGDDTSMKSVTSSQDHEDPDQDENEFAVFSWRITSTRR